MPRFNPIPNVKGRSKKMRYRQQKEFRKDWPLVIADGDSWADYKREFTGQYDLVDHLGGVSFPYTLFPLGEAGAKLQEIVDEREWVDKIDSVRLKFILFSGGGNDISGCRRPQEHPQE